MICFDFYFITINSVVWTKYANLDILTASTTIIIDLTSIIVGLPVEPGSLCLWYPSDRQLVYR